MVVRDQERSEALYSVFGYDPNNAIRFDFVEGESEPEGGPRLSYYAVGETLLPELLARGGQLVEQREGKDPLVEPYGEMRMPTIVVLDPDGYRVEVVTPTVF